LARLIWRYEHISIFRVAKLARQPFICEDKFTSYYTETMRNLEEVEAAQCASTVKAEDDEARQELGDLYGLVAAGEVATISYLGDELNLRERLCEMIERCIKCLLHAKGLKSISTASGSPPTRHLLVASKAD
jgi:hypothetical protein